MSVLIKNVEMPKFCRKCPCVQSKPLGNGHFCTADHFVRDVNIKDAPPDWCPLVEVPTPHGRLIDETQIPYIDLNADMPQSKVRVWTTFKDKIDRLPTIIEAEEGTDHE